MSVTLEPLLFRLLILFVLGSLLFVLVLPPATMRMRRLAQSIYELGGTPSRLLEGAWTGQDYRGLDDQLILLTREMKAVARSLQSQPILFYSRSSDPALSLSLAIANLDESTSLLDFIVPEAQRPPATVLRPLRQAIDQLLDCVEAIGVSPDSKVPPLPQLPPGLAYSDTELTREFIQLTTNRRRLLLGWVKHERRDWPEDF